MSHIEFGIFYCLLDGKLHKAKELAEKFEVSTKTIYRSTDKLVYAGLPITTSAGKNGGIQFANNFLCDTWFFTEKELSYIFNLVVSNHKINPEISAIIASKINNHTSYHLKNVPNSFGSFIVDPSCWFSTTEKLALPISELFSYCSSCSAISIIYNGSQRIIHPYTVVYKENDYYLYAYCTTKKQFRLFKISRITNILDLNEKFKKQQINYQDFPWNTPQKPTTIKICCDKNTKQDLSRWAKITEESDTTCCLNVINNIGLIHRLMQYGDKIKILSPDNIKEALVAECNSIAKIYE